jgi:4-deoxy-L-threo-5-hexosulose-uronate ketol-isomerase
MLTVETRHAIDPATARSLDTENLRRHFHLGTCSRTARSASSTLTTIE